LQATSVDNFNGDGNRAGIAADGRLRADLANVTKPKRYTVAPWLAGKKEGAIYFSVGTTNLH
jgi:hypothetical protein